MQRGILIAVKTTKIIIFRQQKENLLIKQNLSLKSLHKDWEEKGINNYQNPVVRNLIKSYSNKSSFN